MAKDGLKMKNKMKQSNKQKRTWKEFKKNPLGFVKDEIKAKSTDKTQMENI